MYFGVTSGAKTSFELLRNCTYPSRYGHVTSIKLLNRDGVKQTVKERPDMSKVPAEPYTPRGGEHRKNRICNQSCIPPHNGAPESFHFSWKSRVLLGAGGLRIDSSLLPSERLSVFTAHCKWKSYSYKRGITLINTLPWKGYWNVVTTFRTSYRKSALLKITKFYFLRKFPIPRCSWYLSGLFDLCSNTRSAGQISVFPRWACIEK